MKLTVTVFAIALLGGCAASPYKISGPAPTSSPETVYNCALNIATGLGYTPEQANKDSGFFKSERSERKGPSSIYWGATINEEVTVLVLTTPDKPPMLHVTAAANNSVGRNARFIDPTDATKADANKILAACAK